MKKPLCKPIGKKGFRNLLIPLFSFFLFIQVANAQNLKVTGVISSADDGQNIPGATVVNKTLGTGTITDLDGNYSINASTGNVLEFSFVGKSKQTVTITNQTRVDISLKNDIIGLDQVIVVGYGTQKKADLSSAIAVVNAEDIARKPVATFEQTLQGVSSGVEVTGNRGAPGEGAIIRIRGVGTVNSTQPLIVIDGLPTEGSLSLDASEIASVQILKDAAAAAIYGARGGNGVVIISTKRGEKGAAKLDFEAYYGIQQLPKRLDLLNSEEYSKLIIEEIFNAGKTQSNIPTALLDPYNTKYNTDWQDAMFHTAPVEKYNLTYSGSGKNSNYSVSGGYQSQEGILIGSDYTKYHLRFNSDIDQARKYFSLKFGESVSVFNSVKHREASDGNRTQIEQIIKISPTLPIFINDSLGAKGGYEAPTPSRDGHDATNPVSISDARQGTENTKGITGNIYGGMEFFKGLNFKSLVGIDYRNVVSTQFDRKFPVGSSGGVATTMLEKSLREITNLVIENTLTFERTLGRLFTKAIIGYSEEKRKNSYFKASRQNFADISQEMPFNMGSPATAKNEGTIYKSGLQSYFGRVELGWADKYLVTLNARRDGSSKFGKEKRFGEFGSFSAAWRVSEEKFMKSFPMVSDLKLRFSFGTLGNQEMPDYQYEAFLNSNLNYVFGTVQTPVGGVSPQNFPNEIIQWETTKQTDIGIDLGLFDNKLYFIGDYFIKNTEDMLLQLPIPTSSGFAGKPWINTGEVLNKGLELGLSYKKYEGNFHYTLGGNFTYLNNKVISLGDGGEPILAGNVEKTEAVCITRVGDPIGSFYLYTFDGIYKNQAEIDAMNVTDPSTGKLNKFAPKAKPGDIRFKDLNKNGKLDAADLSLVGNSIPKFIYSLTLTGEYKGIDISIFLQGVYGNKIYNEMRYWTEGMFANWNGNTNTLNRFRAEDITYTTVTPEGKTVEIFYPANINTDVPRAVAADANANAASASTRFLEDGSYLRLKSLSIGYNFPKAILEKLTISKLRVYVSGENLLTSTKYSGYDPEIGSNGIGTSGEGIVRGIDNGYYPQARIFLAGIQLSF